MSLGLGLGLLGGLGGLLDDEEVVTQPSNMPYLLPRAGQRYSDPAVELAARNMLASYFGTPDQAGLISQQIPVPIQQVAGLSPLEIQARNVQTSRPWL